MKSIPISIIDKKIAELKSKSLDWYDHKCMIDLAGLVIDELKELKKEAE